jgi:hypothetical protein
VLRRIVEGAAEHCAPGGWLGIVTEVPNVRATGSWLAPLLRDAANAAAATAAAATKAVADDDDDDDDESSGPEPEESQPGRRWAATVLLNAADVIGAKEYSEARALERGWRGEAAAAWERGMAENSVGDMSSALIYGCRTHSTAIRCTPLLLC